ncbi:MAG: hypothetical protein WA294_04190 [Acidobacteriaceae bacterium]
MNSRLRTILTSAIVLFVLSGVCVAQKPNGSDSEASCRTFVQAFYDWYAPIAQRDDIGTTSDYALKERPEVFTARLYKALKADSEAQHRSKELVGLDFDPFLNSQDPSPQFIVDSVTVKQNQCLAAVYGLNNGQREESVKPELEMSDGRWQFVNFHYYDQKLGDYDLLSILRQNAYDRQGHPIHQR